MTRSFCPRIELRNYNNFFGREKEISTIFAYLRSQANVSLMGQRIAGKSWLIKKIYMDKDLQLARLKEKAAHYSFIFWDLRRESVVKKEAFFLQLFEKVIESLPEELRSTYNMSTSIDRNIEQSWRNLIKFLDGKHNIVVLLDEFSAISRIVDFDTDAFNLARTIFQGSPITCVTSTYQSLLALQQACGITSPFFNIFNQLVLGLFSEVEAEEFITDTFNQNNFEILPDAVQKILELVGPHPCFLSQICHNLQDQAINDSKNIIDSNLVENIANSFYESIIDDLRYCWQHLTPRQKQKIRDIANGKPFNQNDPGFGDLRNPGLVITKNGKYELFSKLFQKFVQDEHSSGITVIVDVNEFNQRYMILEEIASSAHSKIEKAKHRYISNRLVAVKSILAGSVSEDVLIREASIVAKLDKHPNIGKIYDAMTNPVRLIMEWIEGNPLEIYIGPRAKEKLSRSEILKIGIKLADVLAYTHRQEVIHRDLKPSNIILRQRDDPVLIDFDIARASDHDTVSRTQNGEQGYIGTPRYSAPEQWSSNPKAISTATDIFALGVILYELFTSVRPFEDGNDMENYGDELPALEQRDIPEQVYTIICQCLRQDPKERLSAEILKSKLEQCGTQIGD